MVGIFVVRNYLFILTISSALTAGCATKQVSFSELDFRWPNDWYIKSTQKLYSGKVIRYRKGTKELIYSANIKNGQYEGEVISWYPNGKMSRRTRYKGGRRHGLDEWWHTTGNKWGEWKFHNGTEVDGTYELWHENGDAVFDWLADEYD